MYYLATSQGFYKKTLEQTMLFTNDARKAFVFDTFNSADSYGKQLTQNKTIRPYYAILKPALGEQHA